MQKTSSGLTHLNQTFNRFGCFCRAEDPAKTTNSISPVHVDGEAKPLTPTQPSIKVACSKQV
jgi:hypothetical protein